MHYTATVRTHLPPLAAGVQHFFLDDDEPPAAGCRPDRIATLSGPQERDLRRTVEQIVDAVRLVHLLDDPVPEMVDQLPDVMRFFDFLLPVPEQVIEVPKILLDDVPMRTAVRDTQLAEQLVEVPTIVSYSWLQFIMEQNVDIPVPGRGGGISGLQGFLPGQSSTAPTVVQIVDIPGGGLQGSRPGQGSPASSSFQSPAGSDDDADEPGKGVFRTFPQRKKKVRSWLRTRGRNCSAGGPPSSGCGSGNATLARLTSGTDATNSAVWQAPAGVEVVWYGERDEEGGIWYWHRDTRISTFDLPPLPPG